MARVPMAGDDAVTRESMSVVLFDEGRFDEDGTPAVTRVRLRNMPGI
ncbi:MAG TPA: hypothetical protein VFU43_10550 [Streptosporangiaceae bacterium]|nr:hypothetical protein [Streptosporangiaceae bacterium]